MLVPYISVMPHIQTYPPSYAHTNENMLAYLKVLWGESECILTPGTDWLNTEVALLCGFWDSELSQLSCAASTPPQISLLGLEMSSSPDPPPHTCFLTDIVLATESNPDEILRHVELFMYKLSCS